MITQIGIRLSVCTARSIKRRPIREGSNRILRAVAQMKDIDLSRSEVDSLHTETSLEVESRYKNGDYRPNYTIG